MKNEQINQIIINKSPSFTETWFEGEVLVKNESHKFWLIHPKHSNPNGEEYACEVRWFFKRVPMKVRAMYPYIIESYLQTLKTE